MKSLITVLLLMFSGMASANVCVTDIQGSPVFDEEALEDLECKTRDNIAKVLKGTALVMQFNSLACRSVPLPQVKGAVLFFDISSFLVGTAVFYVEMMDCDEQAAKIAFCKEIQKSQPQIKCEDL